MRIVVFAERLSWPIQLKEFEDRAKLGAQARRVKEGEHLISAVPDGAILIALDETGTALSSRAFATRIGRWRDDGIADLVFIIGVFLSLMVFLLSYDSISGEREEGTLRLVFSYNVPRDTFLLGKYIGGRPPRPPGR